MDECDRAYLAGYFDGEGSASASKNALLPKIPVAVLILAQRNRVPLERIREDLGYGNLYQARGSGTWHLQIAQAREIEAFVRLIYPYVRQKKKQLRLAYRIARLTGESKGVRLDPRIRERRFELADELAAANLVGRSRPIANRHGSSISEVVAA